MARGRGSTSRRREVRRTIARPAPQWWSWLTRREIVWALVWALSTTLCGTILVSIGRDRPLYGVGQVLERAAVPRVEFRALDEAETRRAAEDARDREPAVYKPNNPYFQKVRQDLNSLLRLGADPNIESIDQIPVETAKSLSLTPAALQELRQFNTDEQKLADWTKRVDQFIDELAGLAVLTPDRYRVERDLAERAHGIVIEHPNPEYGMRARPDALLFDVDGDIDTLRHAVTQLAERFPPVLRRSVIAVVMLNREPTYLFDKDATDKRRLDRFRQEPAKEMTYHVNDVLVAAGTRLTSNDITLLKRENEAYLQSLGPRRFWLLLPAQAGVVALISLGMWIYLSAYAPRVLINPLRGVALTLLTLIAQGFAVGLTVANPNYLSATAAIPTLMVAMVLAITYGQRLALGVAAIHAVLVMVSLEAPASFGLVLITGVAIAVGQLQDIRTRSKLLMVGFWSGLTMAVATLFLDLASRNLLVPRQIETIAFEVLLALLAGLGAGLLVQGILPAVERLFKVTTSMTLRELNDASHPLLRRLAQEAAGTYQHSLRIADMAEAAAEAVEANALLCRVGAMYHDIGKINKPSYFVENQGGGPNRHNKLSPAMSLLIIVGHVKDGIEMAREFKLPPSIRQFIESHHGTTLVEYFYHAAKQRRDAEGEPAPAEFEYRYPGPKPQTREAAIIMICDGVEGAARTLVEPTAVRIEQLVQKMTMKRLLDGQFDECGITLKELHQIEQSIAKMLTAIYHGRIAYPSGNRPQTQPASTPPSSPASAAS